MHTQVYCKKLWSEQSDECRYSCIKNSSQLGCVSTRPLFLSATALFPIVFSMKAAKKSTTSENAASSTFLVFTSGTFQVKNVSTL